MNNLIKVELNQNDELCISGRRLHEFLEVKDKYTQWVSRMIPYGFSEQADFITVSGKSTGGRPSTDHQLTINMAKELCMIQRTDRGKQARQYFIQIEKDYNSPEKIMARALKIADSKIHMLEDQITQDKPYTDFGKALTTADDGIHIGKFAKLLKNAGIIIGRNSLYSWFRKHKYLGIAPDTYNLPIAPYDKQGLFTVTETVVNTPNGTITCTTTLITGKGQQYFTEKLKEVLL